VQFAFGGNGLEAPVCRVTPASLGRVRVHAVSVRKKKSPSTSCVRKVCAAGEGYAAAMYDTSFKHMMADPEIMKVFLTLFVPGLANQTVTDVQYKTTFVPPVPEPGKRKTQVDMDLHVTVNGAWHVIIEMQRRRHAMFDERGLFYAAGTYVNQLPAACFEGNVPWYEHLKPVVAVHLLDYDSQRATELEASVPDALPARVRQHPLPGPCYIKDFRLVCTQSGESLEHLHIRQIELVRADRVRGLWPPQHYWTGHEWFLSVLKHAPRYTLDLLVGLEKQGVRVPDVVPRMLTRLFYRTWDQTLQHAYQAEVREHQAREEHLALIRNEGFEAGQEAMLARLAKAVEAGELTLSQACSWGTLRPLHLKRLQNKVMHNASQPVTSLPKDTSARIIRRKHPGARAPKTQDSPLAALKAFVRSIRFDRIGPPLEQWADLIYG